MAKHELQLSLEASAYKLRLTFKHISLVKISQIATSQFKLIPCNHHAGMGENKISILGIVCEYFKWKIGYIICATDGSLVVLAHKTELKILKLDLDLARKIACVVIWSQYRRVAAYMLRIGNLCHICIVIINNWRTVMWMRGWTKVTELSS